MVKTRLKQIFGGVVLTPVAGCIVCLSAGRWDLPLVWAWVGLIVFFVIISAFVLPPELLAERQQPGPEGRVHDHHRKIVIPLIVLSWIVAGIDLGRTHWSDTVPMWLRLGGLFGYAAAMTLDMWAMRVNRFFSSVVRCQRDRGHEVITAGPYRFVRHPGYVGMIAAFVFEAFVLGSWVAMLPVIVVVALFFRRTFLEDRMLRRELEGYEAYAQQVRSRLVPGVW